MNTKDKAIAVNLRPVFDVLTDGQQKELCALCIAYALCTMAKYKPEKAPKLLHEVLSIVGKKGLEAILACIDLAGDVEDEEKNEKLIAITTLSEKLGV